MSLTAYHVKYCAGSDMQVGGRHLPPVETGVGIKAHQADRAVAGADGEVRPKGTTFKMVIPRDARENGLLSL